MSLGRNALQGQPNNNPVQINWVGASGTPYPMYAYPIGTIHMPVSGVYIFCRESSSGLWTALYVGEAEDINARIGNGLSQHHKADACIRAGATHICTRVVSGARSVRLAVETDLRQKYKPPHNDQ